MACPDGKVTLLSHVLVTGATGFVGAHIVDLLLERGIKVTGTGRSQSKANEMKARRAKYQDFFSMAITGDLTTPGVFDDVVKDVDVVIHVASVSSSPSHCSFADILADVWSRSPFLPKGARILNRNSFFLP